MSDTRKKFTDLMRAKDLLMTMVSMYYSEDGLKNLDNDTLEARASVLGDLAFKFSLHWFNLATIGIKIQREDQQLQNDIQVAIPILKAACVTVKTLCVDIDKLHLTKDQRDSYKNTARMGLPIIYDFAHISMPTEAIRVLGAIPFVYNINNKTKEMQNILKNVMSSIRSENRNLASALDSSDEEVDEEIEIPGRSNAINAAEQEEVKASTPRP